MDHLLDLLQQPPVDHKHGVQCVLEEQINEPSQEGTGSAESSSTEPYLLAEGIPEELRCEWRVLHPF